MSHSITVTPRIPPTNKSHLGVLVLILLTSFLLKLRLVIAAQGMDLVGDQAMYVHMGRLWARGQRWIVDEANLWPPGFVTFLGLCFKFISRDLFWPRLFQVMMSTLSVGFLWIIARRWLSSERLALIAAAGYAFYPTLMVLSTWLWAETLYLFFFLACVASYVVAVERGRRRWFVLTGVLFGLAALTKSVGFYTLGPWMAWHFRNHRPLGHNLGLKRAGAMGAAIFLTIAPWTLRNYLVFDRFVMIDMSLGRNLYYGHNVMGPVNWDWGLGRPFSRSSPKNRKRCDELPGMEHPKDVEKCEVRGALDFIKTHPVETVRRFFVKNADLMAPTSPLVGVLARDAYPIPLTEANRQLITLVTIGAWVVVAVGAVAGVTLVTWNPWQWWFVALLAYYFVLHWATVGQSRYRTTLEPFLIVVAVLGWSGGRAALKRLGLRSPQVLSFVFLLAGLLWMWSGRLGGGVKQLWAYYLG